MKLIKKEIKEGTVLLTVQHDILFGLIKWTEKYSSNSIIVGSYRKWLKEPNKLMVNDNLSFQLNEWNRTYD